MAGVADYTYDVYGNMLTDKNKGITGVTYNHMNLPLTVTINNGTISGTISYLYNAAGVKLKKTVTTGGVSTVTDYLGGYQYVNTVLEFFPTSEGYVKNTVVSGANNYNYVFQYKDNVGNNRISYMVDPADGIRKILEEDHYYAFGLKHNGYSATQQMVRGTGSGGAIITLVPVINPADATYKYMYNGKELQDELGLNMYDFGARNYDPAIGRWMNIDPLAEKARRFSPYVYCNNNPVFFVDPDGMETYTGQDAVDFATGMQIGLAMKDARGDWPPTKGTYAFDEIFQVEDGSGYADNDGKWLYNAKTETWEGYDGSSDISALSSIVVDSSTDSSNTDLGSGLTEAGSPWIAAGAAVAVLAADDATVVGVADDVIIPAVLASAAIYDVTMRVHVTYTMTNPLGQTYVGRTSGFGDPYSIMMRRYAGHHMRIAGYGNPTVDRAMMGGFGYAAIRGREQQLIDFNGGVDSPRVGNAIRGVAKWNLAGRGFHEMSNAAFGPIAPYTGY